METLKHLSVILVEPKSPGNIGMVCRAMANFGVSDLRLVNPCPHLHPEAHKFAVFASDLLGQARIFPDLASALADLHLSIATTRRSGRLRGEPMTAAEAAQLHGQLITDARLGLVFGREDSGLTSAEVAICSHTACIPAVSTTGSLNLAQAVLIFLYESFQAQNTSARAPGREGEEPSQGEVEALFQQSEEVLARIGFLNQARPEARTGFLRQILRRANLSRAEVGLLRGMWDQIAWSVRDWRGRRRGEGAKSD